MANYLCNGKWNPVVCDNGRFVGMTTLINGEWELVECDTKEEAERLEAEHREFWKGSE